MIDLRHVSFHYHDGTQALTDVSVTFPGNRIFAVLGESGSGKTTLLNCMARFLTPQSGEIRLDGQDVFAMTEKQFRQNVGVVFQKLFLFPHLTIFENLTLAPDKVQGLKARQVRQKAHEMLDRLGIMELAESYPSQVSGGQAQRAAIARGLMLQPQYMLLDEPTSALDAETTEDFAVWLRELHEDTNFIIVTHDVLFARQIACHGIYMRQGAVEHSGTIDDILAAISSDRDNGEAAGMNQTQ
ncbi:MAG: amino acid ABC transporter ATP-binding protein [Planctomycetes bacterium]|nr:amino acid ABC transporter ATP-binding protein [Planctomycetota bacterium]